MNTKQKKIFEALMEERLGTSWKEVESLFIALGAQLSEGKGSRVRVLLNDVRAVFHRPHPAPQLHRGQIRSIKRFLLSADIKTDEI